MKTNQLKLIDLFLQLQEKKKSDKRDKIQDTKKDKRKTCHNINNTATSLFLRNRIPSMKSSTRRQNNLIS